MDNEILTAEVCTSSTERMRSIMIAEPDLDLQDMHMEEQNALMGEQMRPRATGSSNDIAMRYVRQRRDIIIED
eukprot:9428241-Heterocapsa_arctica.AAC.1